MRKNLILVALVLTSYVLEAQTPRPTNGQWLQGSGSSQTLTSYNVGVGTHQPAGKMEVKYQPCQTSQNGLLITSLNCNQSLLFRPPLNPGTVILEDLFKPKPESTVIHAFTPTYFTTSRGLPLVDNTSKPMLWIRRENQALAGLSGSTTYDTRFIVLPNGKIGVNANNPRGTLDVVQDAGSLYGEPTAIFARIIPGTLADLQGKNEEGQDVSDPSVKGYLSRQIFFVNQLQSHSYNRISREDDQGIFFSDGMDVNGSNSDGGLIIAPWSRDPELAGSKTGGIRIDHMGNVNIHGDLKATDLELSIRWWSDFVFSKDYKLSRLDSVEFYISHHGHLPGIPSETQILDSGLHVGAMQALQLQKIEELTLYTIEQEKELKRLREKIDEQRLKQEEMERLLKEIRNNQ